MANFFIIDHSLRQKGGHHFDYVSCIARAANELGYLTTIGSNCEFAKSEATSEDSLQQLGNVRRVYRDTTYQPDSYLAGLQHLTRSNASEALLSNFESSWFKRILHSQRHRKHRRRREQFVKRFAADCERFFHSSLQTSDDHAFLTTVSELELMGLAAYLSSNPKTIQTTWHLQFHFNLFEGRTPEYEKQDYIAKAIRSCFVAALARLSDHTINFYATSETLADQYNRLGVGEFEVLPYPVAREFSRRHIDQKCESGRDDLSLAFSGGEQVGQQSHLLGNNLEATQPMPDPIHCSEFGSSDFQSETQDNSLELDGGSSEFVSDSTNEFPRTLRLTCPGALRREKNQVEYLQPLVNDIWDNHLSTGNVQIVVQRPKKKWHAKKSKLEIELPESADKLPAAPVEYFAHPLSKRDYVELVKTSDCGLLFYDSRVYFSRRAGVLGELLSAGKPVIVSAGSWLAEQVQESIFQHVDRLIESDRLVRTIESSEFSWNRRNVPMSGGVLSFDQSRHPFEFTVAREAGTDGVCEEAYAIEFDWHWPTSPGIYCRIDVTQKDEYGFVVDKSSRVVGFRNSPRQVNALFRMQRQTQTVEFSLSNPFHDSTASVKRVRIRTLRSRDEAESEQGFPIGQVGIVASDPDDLSNCVDELVRYFDHYSNTAIEFSDRWYARHQPVRTVGHLVAASQSNRRAA